jgi:glycosyltransferase involved in cell wall biosynthesis
MGADNKTPAVVLTHPSVAPFVQQAARAFAERDMLKRFVTTLTDRPTSPWQRLACRAGGLLGFDLARQLQRRAVTEVPKDLVVSRPWGEVARLAAGKVDRSGIWTDRVWEWAETGFDRWAAANALQGAGAVYGYEHAARACFEVAQRRGLFCIYDVQAPEHDFTQAILDRELERHLQLGTPYQRHIRKPSLHRRRVERRRREWRLADLVIAASQFTRSSFSVYEDPNDPGQTLQKVRVVPYGAPPVDADGVAGGTHGRGPLRCLWAGTFSIRKGAHYLLEAWKKLAANRQTATLDVYGAAPLSATFEGPIPDSVRFRGSVPRAELYEVYKQADVLLFPTLCDGFGMVVTEAFSRGLPVLTTHNAGAADWIRPGQNGLLTPAADVEALGDALAWCLDNRPVLTTMRPEALAAAARWQWSDYRAALAAVVLECFQARSAPANSPPVHAAS